MILIQDGFLQNVCGCEEGEVAFSSSEILTCTVSASTTVIFNYSNSQLSHQVISSGTPNFVSSPIHDPYLQSNNNLTYAVTLSETGTYQFFDAFNETLTGQIIVE